MSKNQQLHRILKKLKKIEDKLNRPKSIDDYVSELEAKKILGRGITWFWEREEQANCISLN